MRIQKRVLAIVLLLLSFVIVNFLTSNLMVTKELKSDLFPFQSITTETEIKHNQINVLSTEKGSKLQNISNSLNQISLNLIKTIRINETITDYPSYADINKDGLLDILIPVNNKLVALSGNLNQVLWTYELNPASKLTIPTIGELDGDFYPEIIIGAENGKLIVLNGEDATILWTFTAGNEYSTAILGKPTIFDLNNDKSMEVIVSSNDHNIYCFEGSTGQLLWKRWHGVNGKVVCAIADVNNDGSFDVINAGGPDSIVAIDGKSGNTISSINLEEQWINGFLDAPKVGDINFDNKTDIIISNNDMLFCFKLNPSFNLVWNRSLNRYTYDYYRSTCVGTIGKQCIWGVISLTDSFIYCFRGDTGDLLWRRELNNRKFCSLCDFNNDSIDEILVVRNFDIDCDLYIINSTNGNIIAKSLIFDNRTLNYFEICDLDNNGNVNLLCCSDDELNIFELSINSYSQIYWHVIDGDEGATSNFNFAHDDFDCDGLSEFVESQIYHTNPFQADTDEDGMPDGWETLFGLNPLTYDSTQDYDNDSLTNLDEFHYNTDPNDNDTDSDSLLDGEEVLIYKTNPTVADTDSDGLTDGDEVNEFGTNPNLGDTDSDGLDDYDELFEYFTNPLNQDTDFDGIPDGWEIANFLNATFNDASLDFDFDGLDNFGEYNHSTNPFKSDTDSDSLLDGEEVFTYFTDPTNDDSDSDGINDGDEINMYNTDPNNSDSDNDDLDDYEEIRIYGTDPNNSDSDNDGLDDYEEIRIYGTDPNNSDSDNDGIPDGWEVDNGFDPNYDILFFIHNKYLKILIYVSPFICSLLIVMTVVFIVRRRKRIRLLEIFYQEQEGNLISILDLIKQFKSKNNIVLSELNENFVPVIQKISVFILKHPKIKKLRKVM
ncbi:MAG: outer membrane protein assembly factor BamB family protein, partial [Candidatus Heimdallarchaeaceae archaeon]